MKAEERKHLEENELQHWLADAWATMTSGSTANTVIWGLIVLGLVVYIGWRSWSRAAETTRSAAWSQFDTAANVEGLDAIIHSEAWANTPAVLPAKFNLSRLQMQDALTRIAGPNRDDRDKAAKALERGSRPLPRVGPRGGRRTGPGAGGDVQRGQDRGDALRRADGGRPDPAAAARSTRRSSSTTSWRRSTRRRTSASRRLSG